MAYLKNWGEVQQWMLDNSIVRWNASRDKSADNSFVFSYNKDKSPDENMLIFESALKRFAGDVLYLVGWRTEAAKTGGFSAMVLYEDQQRHAQPSPVPTTGIGSTIDLETLKSDLRREIKNEFDQDRLTRERKEFEEAKRDFEQKQNGVMGLLVNYLAPVAQQLAGKLQPLPRVAGLDATGVETEPIRVKHAQETTETPEDPGAVEQEVFTDEEADQLFELLARFKKVEPQYMQLIESVVQLAEAKDATYNMAKGFLLK